MASVKVVTITCEGCGWIAEAKIAHVSQANRIWAEHEATCERAQRKPKYCGCGCGAQISEMATYVNGAHGARARRAGRTPQQLEALADELRSECAWCHRVWSGPGHEVLAEHRKHRDVCPQMPEKACKGTYNAPYPPETLALILALAAEGKSHLQIAEDLIERGIPQPNGKDWSRHIVCAALGKARAQRIAA